MFVVNNPRPEPDELLELHTGDRMTQAEFHRVYRQMPAHFRAELIGGWFTRRPRSSVGTAPSICRCPNRRPNRGANDAMHNSSQFVGVVDHSTILSAVVAGSNEHCFAGLTAN